MYGNSALEIREGPLDYHELVSCQGYRFDNMVKVFIPKYGVDTTIISGAYYAPRDSTEKIEEGFNLMKEYLAFEGYIPDASETSRNYGHYDFQVVLTTQLWGEVFDMVKHAAVEKKTNIISTKMILSALWRLAKEEEQCTC